jgi:hypothetical protein
MSSPAPTVSKTEVISVGVGKVGDHKHPSLNHCRLYVPIYSVSPSFETQYLQVGHKKVVYDDIYVNHLRDIPVGQFSSLITNGLSRAKRMIVFPMLSHSANVNLLPCESPFNSSPATVSPQFCRLNLKISGRNLYSTPADFKHSHFINELNGKYGKNGGMEVGDSSSLISLTDYENVFGYWCFDLTRHHAEDSETPLSYEINGSILSPKNLDLLVVIEYEKTCELDVTTGQMLSA